MLWAASLMGANEGILGDGQELYVRHESLDGDWGPRNWHRGARKPK